MIIEIFGPPGVGKTTFTHALATALRERGCAVETTMSYRPAERVGKASQQISAMLCRVSKPVAEILKTVRTAPSGPGRDTPAGLIRLLPPRSLFWEIRLYQYLIRLVRSWNYAAASAGVVLFDQGFMQAVCSLVVLRAAGDMEAFGLALDSVPEPDLLVSLRAPPGVIEERLRDRHARQGILERRLELDLGSNLRFIGVAQSLENILIKRGCPIVLADSTTNEALNRSVAEAAAKVMRLREAGRIINGVIL